MKSDRLRSYARRKVYRIRRLRRGNALATSTARTSAGIFAQAAPQLTVRQNSLPESPANGERRCSMVHGVLLARAGAADHRADASPCAFPPKSANAPTATARVLGAAHAARARQSMTRVQNTKDGGVAGKPVIWRLARNFRLVCLGFRAQPTLPPANLSPSQSLTNQEAGPICRCFSFLS
jgi:hypothetical protein